MALVIMLIALIAGPGTVAVYPLFVAIYGPVLGRPRVERAWRG